MAPSKTVLQGVVLTALVALLALSTDLLAPALTKARSTGLKSPGVSAPSDIGGKELRKKHKGTRTGEN